MEERGYRRDQIGKLTPSYVLNVLFLDRESLRRKPPATPVDLFGQVRQVLFARGWPTWRIAKHIEGLKRGNAATSKR